MFLAKVHVTLKPGVLDPQGKAVQGALKALGYNSVDGVRVGKYLEVRLEAASRDEASVLAGEMCARLLANPVIEQYTFEVVAE